MVFSKEAGPKLHALSGPNAAGKGTASSILRANGFMVISLGDVLRREAEAEDLPKDRDTLMEIAARIRRKSGNPGELAVRAIEQWRSVRDEFEAGLCIDGIRNIVEAEQVQKSGGQITYVDAPIERRFVRAVIRELGGDERVHINDFAEQEKREFEGQGGPLKSNLCAIKDVADILISNDCCLEEFQADIYKKLVADQK